EDEDAKRPSREREGLVSECTRIVNRLRANLARLGIRGFKLTLARAMDRLTALRTPEGVSLPANTLAEMRRDLARLCFVREQIKEIERARAQRLEQQPRHQSTARGRLLSRVVGVGIETADMLVHEVFSRKLRDRKAVARYAGLTGAPNESGQKRRERGLSRAGNARVRRGMIHIAWGFLVHQKDSPLAIWYLWACRLGASPPMRMTASWLRSSWIDRMFVARSPRSMASSPRIILYCCKAAAVLVTVKG